MRPFFLLCPSATRMARRIKFVSASTFACMGSCPLASHEPVSHAQPAPHFFFVRKNGFLVTFCSTMRHIYILLSQQTPSFRTLCYLKFEQELQSVKFRWHICYNLIAEGLLTQTTRNLARFNMSKGKLKVVYTYFSL